MDHNEFIGIVIQLLPILLLIGVWIFFMARMRGPNSAAAKQLQYLADNLEESRQLNRTLERVAIALERRNGG